MRDPRVRMGRLRLQTKSPPDGICAVGSLKTQLPLCEKEWSCSPASPDSAPQLSWHTGNTDPDRSSRVGSALRSRALPRTSSRPQHQTWTGWKVALNESTQ